MILAYGGVVLAQSATASKYNLGRAPTEQELHPFAPILWSWINVAMPLQQQGYLTPDEVYSLTAYLLHRNGIIKEGDVMDAQSLPRVQMPNRDGYVPPPFSEWKPGLRGK